MKTIHVPNIDLRYWAAIALASVFGTNMGDLYAHESGLGTGLGLVVLAALTAMVFLAERLEGRRHELYYWLVIIIIRTGATNIADFFAWRLRLPAVPLSLTLAAIIAVFAWLCARDPRSVPGLPQTNAAYWLAMLGAGVFGTAVGDYIKHALGMGVSSLVLTLVLVIALQFTKNRTARFVWIYWITVTIARTTGTAVGDWLAEAKYLNVGLPLSTLISGIAFAIVVLLWKGAAKSEPVYSKA
ncbi:MAG: hypothetical protein JSR65_07895 [Proteobacteria bacterium]|nr:hypothetical protein [Pseudomonadota bacterium]